MAEIRFSGFGGQGIVRCGLITGKALSLFDKKNATMTQSFGPEARGSACSSQLVVSEDRVLYPYITKPGVLISMSQEAYDKFTPELARGGTLLYDEDLAKPTNNFGKTIKVYSIPATRYAEELGGKIVANIIMLGFFSSISELIQPGAMEKAVQSSTPKAYADLNIQAFRRGYESGLNTIKKKK